MTGRIVIVGLLGCAILGAMPAVELKADEVTVAVAANFATPLRALEAEFELVSGHEMTISSGSTGQLYAQILNGAPFDLFLAADRQRPQLLADAGIGVAGSVRTYAIGQLALWSADSDRVSETTLGELAELEFRWLAIASAEVAPYGNAARQTLQQLGVWEALQARLVRGQNVAQAFAMAASGSAELGMVALAQALAFEGESSYALVPAGLHEPIRQDLILLQRASANPAALALTEFLASPAAIAEIERHGYLMPN